MYCELNNLIIKIKVGVATVMVHLRKYIFLVSIDILEFSFKRMQWIAKFLKQKL